MRLLFIERPTFWLPTRHEVARAGLKAAGVVTVLWLFFAWGAASEEKYQMVAAQTLLECRIQLDGRLLPVAANALAVTQSTQDWLKLRLSLLGNAPHLLTVRAD